ncbi:SsrA-binding protein [Parcubacteria bacterium DG_74_3]|nr:MAG: SsrA-binding protein [Parcubacteria bacterium DG_74_3]
MRVIAHNKKAVFNYKILDKFEAGISLIGQEVKSIKSGKITLGGSYVILRGATKKGLPEVFLVGCKIPAYQPKNAPPDYNPARSRKLLLKKIEIKSLVGKIKQKGLTLIPLRVYTKKGQIKIEFGIARGLRKIDKRELLKKREVERKIGRALRGDLG